jgi:hypothetical protein
VHLTDHKNIFSPFDRWCAQRKFTDSTQDEPVPILPRGGTEEKAMTAELTLEQMLAALIPNDHSAEVSVELDADSLSAISAPTEVASQEETQILKRLTLLEWPDTAASDA